MRSALSSTAMTATRQHRSLTDISLSKLTCVRHDNDRLLVLFAAMVLMSLICSTGTAQDETPPPPRAIRPALYRPSAAQPNVRPSTAVVQVTSVRAAGSENEAKSLVDLGPGPDFASQLPDDDSQMIRFIEIMQWTVAVLLIAVLAALTLRKFGRGKLLPMSNSAISHVATLPIKNHFQAHLLEVGKHTFLVTTDRSGVKTVNQINCWQDFDTPIDESSPQFAAS